MAQYTYDFGAHTVGSTPGDLTPIWAGMTSYQIVAGNDVSGDRHLQLEAGTGSALKWDALDAVANRDVVDQLVAFKVASVATSTNPRGGVGMLGNADRDGYFAGISDATNARVRSVSNNSEVTVTSNTAHGPYTANVLWWMRVQRDATDGGTIRTKLWTGHPVDDQPAGWGTTTVNTTITVAGWIFLFSTSTASDMQVHYWSVGTNGDAAPAPGAGDTTAPVLSSGVGTETSDTTATIGATTDEANGTLFAVLSLANSAPTGTQVEAGQNAAGATAAWNSGAGQAITTTGAKTFNTTGLAAGTTYYPYLMHKDAAGNRSTVLAAPSFTTTSGGGNVPPVWSGTPSAMASKRGQAIAAQDVSGLVSDADLDTLSYSISGAPAGVTINSSTGVISGTPTASVGTYACTVSASDGVNGPVASGSFNITVQSAQLMLNTAGYEVLMGNAPATSVGQAGATFQVEVYPIDQWPLTLSIASASAALNASHRLADLSDGDLVYGTTYRVEGRLLATLEPFTWLMVAG